ncbi:MAG: hypothetical protein F4010_05295 [Cenarchaeum sp. SB0669_bin_11]|nr:hypothetical protein [Cenarchaeum sp. SB0669_bin_11]
MTRNTSTTPTSTPPGAEAQGQPSPDTAVGFAVSEQLPPLAIEQPYEGAVTRIDAAAMPGDQRAQRH